jgi:hypothetical protein
VKNKDGGMPSFFRIVIMLLTGNYRLILCL